MRIGGCFLLVAVLVIQVGCSRPSTDNGNPGTAAAATSDDSAPGPESPDSWTYQSVDHGFSLELPSRAWKSTAQKRHVEDFWCRTGTGSAMLAGVSSVKKQTREEFDASVVQFRMEVIKQGDFLKDPVFRKGQSRWGCPFVFADWCERGPSAVQFLYVATAIVWVPEKGIAVGTLFEGQGRMRSKVFQSIESADFEKAANLICTSVR